MHQNTEEAQPYQPYSTSVKIGKPTSKKYHWTESVLGYGLSELLPQKLSTKNNPSRIAEGSES